MDSYADMYCRLVEQGAEVGDPRLLKILECMAWPEIDSLQARLRGEGEALLREANALETDHALRQCGVRVQWPGASDDDIDF